MQKQWLKSWLVIVFTVVLFACSNEHTPAKPLLYIAKMEPVNKTLLFAGSIQPLHESTLTAPLEAILEKMHYHYGQMVKQGDVVFTLNSSALQKQYNETLTEYLKAKDSFSVIQTKFIGTMELWKAGLLSKNNYLSEKSGLDTARIALMQTTKKLSDMLDKMDNDNSEDLSSLSLSKFDKVKQALTRHHNLIRVKSPASGILLYPPKNDSGKSERFTIGSSFKSGQVIGLIGDLSGIVVEIDVPEVDIAQLEVGMPVEITGIALGKEVLHGELVAVNSQASNDNNVLPFFRATVEVKKLSLEQQKRIKVGMSATISIITSSKLQLLVPINAVRQEHGNSIVYVQDKNGKVSPRKVTTGLAQADKVVIESGLQPNDIVRYG